MVLSQICHIGGINFKGRVEPTHLIMNKGNPMLNFKSCLLALGLGATALMAQAADITGAGATFPYPIYAKWAEIGRAHV